MERIRSLVESLGEVPLRLVGIKRRRIELDPQRFTEIVCDGDEVDEVNEGAGIIKYPQETSEKQNP